MKCVTRLVVALCVAGAASSHTDSASAGSVEAAVHELEVDVAQLSVWEEEPHHQLEEERKLDGTCAVVSAGDVSYDVAAYGKTQTRMNDCWYACIQMLLSYKCGAKTKPSQDPQGVTQTARGHPLLGRQAFLNTDDAGGAGILEENHLMDLTGLGRPPDGTFGSLATQLRQRGPIIVRGLSKIAGIRTGHLIVVSGVETCEGGERKVRIYDPAWHLPGMSTGHLHMTEQEFQAWVTTNADMDDALTVAVQVTSDDWREDHPDWCDDVIHRPLDR